MLRFHQSMLLLYGIFKIKVIWIYINMITFMIIAQLYFIILNLNYVKKKLLKIVLYKIL